jgi:hypothetical protein
MLNMVLFPTFGLPASATVMLPDSCGAKPPSPDSRQGCEIRPFIKLLFTGHLSLLKVIIKI